MTDSAVTPERIAELHKIVEQHVRAIGPGGEKAWLAGQLAAAAHGLLAHIKVLTDELAAKTEVAKSNKRVVESYAEEVERVTRERDELERDEAKALRERDDRARVADDLAEAIDHLTGVEIGEHSSANDPWANALAAVRARHGRNAPIESPPLRP